MFNVLNRFISRLDGDSPPAQKENHGAFGFQVLRNANSQLGIEPWFDFVVGINGRMIDDSDPGLFAQEVRNCAGGAVMLGLWSAKGQRTRALHIPVPADTASLGLTLQWTPLSVASNVWHVLDVPAHSPADAAGLLPYGDYVLGTPEGVLHGEGGLGELVEDHIGRPLRLYVYNNEYDVTRVVTIQPSRDWGGEGALGCVLGYGALHRLPAPLSEPVSAPGETLFDGDSEHHHHHGHDHGHDGHHHHHAAGAVGQDGQSDAFMPPAAAAAAAEGEAEAPPPPPNEFLVPAQMVSATSPPPPPTGGGAGAAGGPPRGKKKDRHAHAANPLMDDYFKEQEKRSRELDDAPVGRTSSPLPPPPKAGGGPPRGPPPPPRAETPKAGEAGGE